MPGCRALRATSGPFSSAPSRLPRRARSRYPNRRPTTCFPPDAPGLKDQTMRELTYNEAALEAVAEEMRRDPKIFYMSTDALPPLLKEFGDQRLRATPITDAALTGMAIGAAGCGLRPLVDRRQVTFRFLAMDQDLHQP